MFSKNKKTFCRIGALLLCLILTASFITACAPLTTTEGEGGESGETGGGMNMMVMFLYLGVIILVFYFLMIRPEKKRKKKAQEMRDSLAIGDNITTIGGMVGKIVNISDEFVTFETGEDRVRIKIAKWGISSTGKDAQEPDEKAESREPKE